VENRAEFAARISDAISTDEAADNATRGRVERHWPSTRPNSKSVTAFVLRWREIRTDVRLCATLPSHASNQITRAQVSRSWNDPCDWRDSHAQFSKFLGLGRRKTAIAACVAWEFLGGWTRWRAFSNGTANSDNPVSGPVRRRNLSPLWTESPIHQRRLTSTSRILSCANCCCRSGPGSSAAWLRQWTEFVTSLSVRGIVRASHLPEVRLVRDQLNHAASVGRNYAAPAPV